MNKEIGINVRVFVGWVPSDSVNTNGDPRMKTGTVTAGPFNNGDVVMLSHGVMAQVSDGPYWNVDMDYGAIICAPERVLTPIGDDGEPVDTETRITEPAEG